MLARHFALWVSLLVIGTAIATEQPKNLLFYGNSFTIAVGSGASRSVNALVKDIAVAAGHPEPFVHSAAVAGQSLKWHLENNRGPIHNTLPEGEFWDGVVLQDYSTRPTVTGNLPEHRASYLGLYEKVLINSPDAKAIGFETWARAEGHSIYDPGRFFTPFPNGPASMQEQLRDGYALSTADVNAIYGPGASRVASVGTAWENANWDNLHYTDKYHANDRGTLLAALVIYGTIYDESTVSDIDLTGVLDSVGLGAADGVFLANAANTVLVPEPSTLILLSCIMIGIHRRR